MINLVDLWLRRGEEIPASISMLILAMGAFDFAPRERSTLVPQDSPAPGQVVLATLLKI